MTLPPNKKWFCTTRVVAQTRSIVTLSFYGSLNQHIPVKRNEYTTQLLIPPVEPEKMILNARETFPRNKMSRTQRQEQRQHYINLLLRHTVANTQIQTVKYNKTMWQVNKNLAIANRSRVSCAHNTLRASIGINITPWPWNLGKGHSRSLETEPLDRSYTT